MSARKRVAILGAGPAGLATAMALAETRRFEVHVYQMGWRAGGKCATGREPETQRSVQNGSHYLFGCYHNAFALIRKAHAVLAKSKKDHVGRFGRFKEDFESRNLLVGAQRYGRQNNQEESDDWYRYLPQNMSEPGTGGKFPTPFDYSFMMAQFGLGFCIDVAAQVVSLFAGQHASRDRFLGMRFCLRVFRLDPFEQGLQARLVRALLRPPRWIVDAVLWRLLCASFKVNSYLFTLLVPTVLRNYAQRRVDVVARGLLDGLRMVSKGAYAVSLHLPKRLAHGVQRKLILVDLVVTLAYGYYCDGLGEAGGFEKLDELDFRKWLENHGARQQTIDSALITTWYDATISYLGGKKDKAECSAGTAVLSMLRALLTYKGAFAYQMRAEVGDSFVAPIVKALEETGVHFHFYSRVKKIVVSSEDRLVHGIVLGVQCDEHGPKAEFVEVGDREFRDRPPRMAWPARPRCGACGDLEVPLDSYYCDHEVRERTIDLRRGKPGEREEAFDLVVAALPLGMMEDVLVNHDGEPVREIEPDWRDTFREIRHTESQALRIWFNVPLQENSSGRSLGWCHEPPILSGYEWPFSTWEDNSQAISVGFPRGQAPLTIATVFGALETPPDAKIRERAHYDRQSEVARSSAKDFVDDERKMRRLWPGLRRSESDLRVDWPSFIDPRNRDGEERFQFQHVIANVGPIESYVQASPSTLKYRLRPDESGYRNLFLAGDWTRNGVEVGSVEGAVISGLKAARAISGEGEPIIGGNDFDRGDLFSSR